LGTALILTIPYGARIVEKNHWNAHTVLEKKKIFMFAEFLIKV
jgi:hypothetical protein